MNIKATNEALIADPISPSHPICDYADAAAELLAAVIAKLRAGHPPNELGREVILIGRIMERRT